MTSRAKVAIVHDFLVSRGGAERVVLSLSRAFPEATIHTALFAPELTFQEFALINVSASWVNSVPTLRRHHRWLFPFAAPLFTSMKIDADVVICSSSGWAHGIRGDSPRVVLCYNPARWLYTPDQYLGSQQRVARLFLNLLRPVLKRWDRRAARRASRYLAISSVVRDRIKTNYAIEPTLLHPPVSVDAKGPMFPPKGVEPGFFLTVARLLPYKMVTEVVAALSQLPSERLVVVGDGPLLAHLRRIAPRNVLIAGSVSDAELRWLYSNCAGVVSASYEDYGLTPIEGYVFGKPSATLRWGGFLETVREGETGVHFDQPIAAEIASALRHLRAATWDSRRIVNHAATFSEARFISTIRAIVAELSAEDQHPSDFGRINGTMIVERSDVHSTPNPRR